MIIIELFERGQRHVIRREFGPSSSGSTPHDHITILEICQSASLALNRPQQSVPRYPSVVTNHPTIYRARHHPQLIHQPLHPRTA
jgi:hypothetical protein